MVHKGNHSSTNMHIKHPLYNLKTGYHLDGIFSALLITNVLSLRLGLYDSLGFSQFYAFTCLSSGSPDTL